MFGNVTQHRRGFQLVAVSTASLIILAVAVTVASFASPYREWTVASAKPAPSASAVSQIIHHAGAWDPTGRKELQALLNGGMNLVLAFPPFSGLEAAAPHSQARYIDNLIWLIYDNVPGAQPVGSPKSCVHTSASGCVITPAAIVKIHAAISKELKKAARDPQIVGFYIQDDRIGDTRQLNKDIHSWIAKAGLHKPTICGFGGRLDVPSSPAWMSKIPSFAASIIGSGKNSPPGSFANYSPQGCDMVALYPFDPNGSDKSVETALANATDWKMSSPVWPCGPKKCTLLDFYKYALRQQGWTPATPLIATPQSFGVSTIKPTGQPFYWNPPTSKQLADETAAFCAGGAQAVLAFTWHDFDTGSTSPYTNKSLSDGLSAGVKACKAIWKHSASAAK